MIRKDVLSIIIACWSSTPQSDKGILVEAAKSSRKQVKDQQRSVGSLSNNIIHQAIPPISLL